MRWFAAALVACLLGATAAAQFGRLPEGPWVPPRFRPPGFHDAGFTHCKLMFRSSRREANGMGWATDYPYAAINLLTRVGELTKATISRDGDREPNYWVVRATDPALFECPFLMGTDVGTASFSPEEAAKLRDYFLKGGFLWVDDFWGSYAWDVFEMTMARVLDPQAYPFREIGPEHPVYRTMFPLDDVPQIPSIQFWGSTGGATSERGSDSAQAHLRGIADAHGRLMVLATHNTDISDAWEREGEDPEYFYRFSPNGYATAINIVLYAMSH